MTLSASEANDVLWPISCKTQKGQRDHLYGYRKASPRT